MKNKVSKTLGENILMVGEENDLINQDEVDVMNLSYILQGVREGRKVISILSDDTYVFVLLIFWVWKLMISALVQMKKWDRNTIQVNDPTAALGDKRLRPLGMHAVTVCDTVSHPFSKGKLTALTKLQGGPTVTHHTRRRESFT